MWCLVDCLWEKAPERLTPASSLTSPSMSGLDDFIEMLMIMFVEIMLFNHTIMYIL